MTGSSPTAGDPELSARELEVLALLATGMSNAEIASELYIGIETVKTHLSATYRKLGVERRGQAAAWMNDRLAEAGEPGSDPAGPLATATTEAVEGGRLVVLAGELDVTTTELLTGTINEALAARPAAIRLDLGQVTFIDSAALRVLVALRTGHRDLDVTVTAASPSVRRVLEYTDLVQFFGLAD